MKKTKAIKMEQHSARLQLKRCETGGGTGANRATLSIRPARDNTHEVVQPIPDQPADNTREEKVTVEQR